MIEIVMIVTKEIVIVIAMIENDMNIGRMREREVTILEGAVRQQTIDMTLEIDIMMKDMTDTDANFGNLG